MLKNGGCRAVCGTAMAMPLATLLAIALTAAMAIALSKPAYAAGDQGLAELHRVVDSACDCAQGQRSGMAAALACTEGPREFGRLKVANRDSWNAAARSRATDLEQVIQTCLSNAISAQSAREQLGQRPIRADGSVPAVYWKSIAIEELRPGGSDLVRVSQGSGQSMTGIVETNRAGVITLRRARRDGGGIEQIAAEDIDKAWVMVVNSTSGQRY